MKATKPMTADSATKPKGGGMRALRASRRKAYYAMRPAITLANKKRTLARHLRHFPEDLQATRLYVERYRAAAFQATGKAQAREARRERERLQIARIKHALAQPTAPFEASPPAYAPFT